MYAKVEGSISSESKIKEILKKKRKCMMVEIGKGRLRVCKLAFLTLCDQAFNSPFLGGKIIELAKFCFMNKRFETNLSFFSKLVIVSHFL